MLLDKVQFDGLLSRQQRQVHEAREVTEGAVMEAINDLTTPDQMPLVDSVDMTATYSADPTSAFDDAATKKYDVDLALVRIVPVPESSALLTRALVYEVSARGSASRGEANFEVRAEVFRIASFKPGTVVPRRHAR